VGSTGHGVITLLVCVCAAVRTKTWTVRSRRMSWCRLTVDAGGFLLVSSPHPVRSTSRGFHLTTSSVISSSARGPTTDISSTFDSPETASTSATTLTTESGSSSVAGLLILLYHSLVSQFRLVSSESNNQQSIIQLKCEYFEVVSRYYKCVLNPIATMLAVVKFSRNGPERRSATCVWRPTT